MRIDWAALGLVAAVSIGASVAFVVLLAAGIRLISAARVPNHGSPQSTATLSVGYAMIGLAGLLVLFGIYLIVPQFH